MVFFFFVNKSQNGAGWLFVDYRNDMNQISKNTIIYGHNVIKNDLMFGSLENILEPSWYNNLANQIITFNIKDNSYNWQVFSIYTIEKTSDYLYVNFDTDEDFLSFIDKLMVRSIYDFNVELKGEDKILTLSTCYKDNSNRVVLHAKMI